MTRPVHPGPRQRRWLVVVAVVLVVGLSALLAGCAADTPTPTGDFDTLTREKIAEEVRKLRFETDRAASGLGVALAVGPFLTVIVAVLTFGAAVGKQMNDRVKDRVTRADQLEKDRLSREDQQTKDRQSRETQQAQDRQLRFDTLFATAATQLAAVEEGLQVAGAASLLRLQNSADDQMQNEIVLYCSTQLRIGTSLKVRQIIKEVLTAALYRATTGPVGDPGRLKALNLEGADLSGIDLSGVNLRHVRLDFSKADLAGANLSGADLWGLRAPGVHLQMANCEGTNFGPAKLAGANLQRARLAGARLASADLRGCDLSGAILRGAALQSTHFEGSVLDNTKFERADINDAYFTDDRPLTQATLKGLTGAKNRDSAHGLPPVAARIHND